MCHFLSLGIHLILNRYATTMWKQNRMKANAMHNQDFFHFSLICQIPCTENMLSPQFKLHRKYPEGWPAAAPDFNIEAWFGSKSWLTLSPNLCYKQKIKTVKLEQAYAPKSPNKTYTFIAASSKESL